VAIAALVERFEVRRIGRVPDGMGGYTESETSLGNAAGRIATLNRVVDPTLADRLGGRPPYRIVLDARGGPVAQVGDILVGADGRRFVAVAISRQGRIALVTAGEV